LPGLLSHQWCCGPAVDVWCRRRSHSLSSSPVGQAAPLAAGSPTRNRTCSEVNGSSTSLSSHSRTSSSPSVLSSALAGAGQCVPPGSAGSSAAVASSSAGHCLSGLLPLPPLRHISRLNISGSSTATINGSVGSEAGGTNSLMNSPIAGGGAGLSSSSSMVCGCCCCQKCWWWPAKVLLLQCITA